MAQEDKQENEESRSSYHDQEELINKKIYLLVEEWKKNVELYMDQDKGGLQRITMFIVIHAGLFAFYGKIYSEEPEVGLIIIGIGFFLTFITKRVSNRAHALTLYRRIQGMLIENKLKKIIESIDGKEVPWKSLSGIITTFTREHLATGKLFDKPIPLKWRPLMDEVADELGEYESELFNKDWRPSIGHLHWLTLMYNAVYVLWILLFILTLLKITNSGVF